MKPTTTIFSLLFTTALLAGCSDGVDVTSTSSDTAATSAPAGKPQPVFDGASPGKPSAPITIDYEIVGNPIVGAPT